jgi:hypothetical protein
MSTALIIAPIIIANWPAITAAVMGAAAAMGLAVKQAVQDEAKNRNAVDVQNATQVEVEVKDSQVLTQNIATGQELVLTKGTVELRIRRDERGRCSVCAKGLGHTETELRAIAEEFTDRMTQFFIYNRVLTELKAKGFQVVNEEVGQDESVRIHVRRWES